MTVVKGYIIIIRASFKNHSSALEPEREGVTQESLRRLYSL